VATRPEVVAHPVVNVPSVIQTNVQGWYADNYSCLLVVQKVRPSVVWGNFTS